MKHLSDILNLMNFNQQLQVELEKDMKRINDLKLAKENTSPTGAGGK